MDVFIGIDGTGPSSDEEYREKFGTPGSVSPNQSHIFTFKQAWHSKIREYSRGPRWHGLRAYDLANWATRIAFHHRRAKDARIFMFGYSRGGAAAIQAATMLKVLKVDVHCLILLDAVDRSATLVASDTIPGNVRFCFHAMRESAGRSRWYFGNCGMKAAPGVQYSYRRFAGTHGAIGGLPWGADSVDENGFIFEGPKGAVKKGSALLGKGVGAGFTAALSTKVPLPIARKIGNAAGQVTESLGTRLASRAVGTRITPAQDQIVSKAVAFEVRKFLAMARAQA